MMDRIFHVDDLGATPQISDQIFEAWEAGWLDGFSVFANCDHWSMITERLARNPERAVRLGIHLNLTEGTSVCPAAEVPSLVDVDGYFRHDFLGIFKAFYCSFTERRTRLLGEIEREWTAQIETVIGHIAPRRLDVLDSHMHIHMIPFLFRLACRLARTFSIPSLRLVREPFDAFGRESFSFPFVQNIAKHVLLRGFALEDAWLAKRCQVSHPDGMLGVLYSGMMNEAAIRRQTALARRLGFKNLEILFHIGKAGTHELARWKNDTGKAAFVLSENRRAEYEALKRLKDPCRG